MLQYDSLSVWTRAVAVTRRSDGLRAHQLTTTTAMTGANYTGGKR